MSVSLQSSGSVSAKMQEGKEAFTAAKLQLLILGTMGSEANDGLPYDVGRNRPRAESPG